MRLFVALDLDSAVRGRLAALIEELRAAAPGIRWVAAESIHLTLKFIGEQPEQKLEPISDVLTALPRPGPLQLRFHGLGCFPNERRPRVFWVGVDAPAELARLAAAIEQALVPLGVEAEQRPFSPHLTLGRAKQPTPISALGGKLPSIIEGYRQAEFGMETAHEFYLYQSRLSPAGARYSRLRTYPL